MRFSCGAAISFYDKGGGRILKTIFLTIVAIAGLLVLGTLGYLAFHKSDVAQTDFEQEITPSAPAAATPAPVPAPVPAPESVSAPAPEAPPAPTPAPQAADDSDTVPLPEAQ